MAEAAVEVFAEGIRRAESGTADGDYQAVRGLVRGTARLLGAYGIPSDNWAEMAEDAGLTGARWRDARAQDAVATATFTRLYAKYRDWRLVAVAWKGGEVLADAVADNPPILSDPSLKPVKGYATSVMQNVQEKITVNPDSGVEREFFPTTFDNMTPRITVEGEVPRGTVGGGDEAEDVLRRRLYAMRDRVRNQAVPDPAAVVAPEGDTRVSGEGGGSPPQETTGLRRLLPRRRESPAVEPSGTPAPTPAPTRMGVQ